MWAATMWATVKRSLQLTGDGALLCITLLCALAAGGPALSQDVVAQRFFTPSPPSSTYAGALSPQSRVVDLGAGWSAFGSGYRIHGDTRTDNVVADGNFTSHGYVIGLAKRLSPNVTIGLRGQHGDNDVRYAQITSREQTSTSQGVAIDIVVEDEHVVWRNTVSAARDRFHETFTPFTAGDWNGTEWAFDTQANLRFRFARLLVSPYVGFRYLALSQDAFIANNIFATMFPAQERVSSQLRTGTDLRLSVATFGPVELLALAGGAVRVETDPHPPIATAADLTAMAGNSFSFDYANAEPARFPGSVAYTANAGLELRAADTFHLFVNAVTSRDPMLRWHAFEAGGRVLF